MIKPASSFGQVEVIRTETFIDRLSGLGGIPKGRITEVWGDSGVGKSSVILQAIASAQKQGQRCLAADVEWTFDALYAKQLGVDTDNLGLLQEQFAETVLDEIEKQVSPGNYDLIVLDSVGGLHTSKEAEKGAGEKTMASQAGILAPFLRRIVPLLAMKNVALVVINHSFVDIMTGAVMTSGGKKLNYHRSLSIRLQYSGTAIKQGEKKIGQVIKASVKRNKLAATEGMEVTSNFLYSQGFMGGLDILDEAIERGIFTKTGNTFFYNGDKIGMIGVLRKKMEDESFLAEIKARL